MLVDEVIEDRHDIIISDADISLCIRILQLQLPVLIEHHLIREAAALHVLIVADIVLRHHERLLPLRQHDLLRHHLLRAVVLLLHLRDVVKPHEHVAALIHLLQDLLELRDGRHDLIEVLPLPVIGKRALRIHRQDMEEHMRDLTVVRRHHRRCGRLIALDPAQRLRVLLIVGVRQCLCRGIIVIHRSESICLRKECRPRILWRSSGLCFAAVLSRNRHRSPVACIGLIRRSTARVQHTLLRLAPLPEVKLPTERTHTDCEQQDHIDQNKRRQNTVEPGLPHPRTVPRLTLRPTRREPLLIQPLHLLRICIFRIRVILALIRIIHRLTRRDIIRIIYILNIKIRIRTLPHIFLSHTIFLIYRFIK